MIDPAGNVPDARAQAAEAYARGDWYRVVELLDGVEAATLTAEELVHRWTSELAVGRWDESILSLERAYSRFSEDGDHAGAAWSALQLSFWAGAARGDMAVSGGWAAMSRRHFEGLPECRAHVLRRIFVAYGLIRGGEYDRAVEMMVGARELARGLGERDLEMWATQREGHARALGGDLEAGMALMDEAMVASLSTRLAPYVVQQTFCETLTVCYELGDLQRASQWIEACDRVTKARGLEWSGDCHIHRAGIMKQRGSLPRAEAEARLGCGVMEANPRNLHYGWGWAELGEIRLRLGDLDGAAEAFNFSYQNGWLPNPGFALLRMAQGNPDLAAKEIGRALEEQVLGPLRRVRLLEAAVVIRLAVGDMSGAEAARAEIAEHASRFPTDFVTASASCAEGLLAAARGDAEAGVASLRAGVSGWLRVGAPYEAALARVRLAEVMLKADDPHAARLELQAARSTFLDIGAERDAGQTSALLVEIDGRAPDPSAGDRVEKTFMFTDIQQSTALAAAMGDEEWDRILRSHDRLLRDAIREAQGYVVKHEGDGLFAAFDQPAAAVDAAVSIQQRLAAHREEHGFAPSVRIGLHTGTATERNGDYFGMAVNTAARVMSLAAGGEIVASATLADGSGAIFSEPRSVALKGLSEPTRVVDVLWRNPQAADRDAQGG